MGKSAVTTRARSPAKKSKSARGAKGIKNKSAEKSGKKAPSGSMKKKDSTFNHFIGSKCTQVRYITRIFQASPIVSAGLRIRKDVPAAVDVVIHSLLRDIAQSARALSANRKTVALRDLQGAVQSALVSDDIIAMANKAGMKAVKAYRQQNLHHEEDEEDQGGKGEKAKEKKERKKTSS